jgi:hypothetical protein
LSDEAGTGDHWVVPEPLHLADGTGDVEERAGPVHGERNLAPR